MALREVGMWEILAVLERVGRGESQAAVARTTGHGRKTIRSYVRTARSLGGEVGGESPSEALAAAVFERHRPAEDRGIGGLALSPRDDPGVAGPAPNETRGLQPTRVHEPLERQGVRVAHSTLHRFAVKHCGFGRGGRTTVRMAECEPGDRGAGGSLCAGALLPQRELNRPGARPARDRGLVCPGRRTAAV